MEVEARPAAGVDVPRILELAGHARAELTGERGGELWAVRDAIGEPLRPQVARRVDGLDGVALVGTIDGTVVAYSLAHVDTLRDGSRLAVLTDLYVEPGAREVGLGEALLDRVLDWARALGCRGVDAIALPGMREAKNLFERCGLTARAIVVHRRLDGEA